MTQDSRDPSVESEEKTDQEKEKELEPYLNPLKKDEQDPVNQSRRDPRGRKPKYSDPHELWEKCQEYFQECDGMGRSYTIPDLAFHLGFVSRQAIFHMERRDDDCGRVIQAAKLKIEGQRNRQVVEGQGQMAGRIFDLKCNFGYRDTLDDLRDTTRQINIQQNNMFQGLPPQAESLEEWSAWAYKELRRKHGGQPDEEKALEENDSRVIDVDQSGKETQDPRQSGE